MNNKLINIFIAVIAVGYVLIIAGGVIYFVNEGYLAVNAFFNKPLYEILLILGLIIIGLPSIIFIIINLVRPGDWLDL